MTEIFESSQVNSSNVLKLFRDAYLDCSLDEDGDIMVREAGVKIYVTFHKEGEGIVMRSSFGFLEASTRAQQLLFSNRINEEYIMVRGYAFDATFVLDYVLRTEGGVVKRAIIYALKLFARICSAVWDEGREQEQVLA